MAKKKPPVDHWLVSDLEDALFEFKLDHRLAEHRIVVPLNTSIDFWNTSVHYPLGFIGTSGGG